MKAIITVIGRDTVGILAKVTGICEKANVNISDVTQTVMREYFAMIMLADTSRCGVSFGEFSDELKALGDRMNLQIQVMHEDIFNYMHRI